VHGQREIIKRGLGRYIPAENALLRAGSQVATARVNLEP